MDNNANKVIAVVGAFLVAAIAFLVMSSGLNGGGGGSSVPVDSSSQGSTQTQDEMTVPIDGSSTSGDPAADMTIDELKALIDQSAGSTGQNARDAATSPNVPEVSTVYQEVVQRGFDGAEVAADFDINGNYSNLHTLEANSSEKFPSYTMFYQSTQGVLWVLYVNDGAYIAVPMGTSNGMLSKEIIVVESDVVVQYDGIKNEFSDRPVSSITNALVIRVTSVDKATLDSYSAEQLEAM